MGQRNTERRSKRTGSRRSTGRPGVESASSSRIHHKWIFFAFHGPGPYTCKICGKLVFAPWDPRGEKEREILMSLRCFFRHRWECESTTTGWVCTRCGKCLSFDDHFKDRGEKLYDALGGSLAEASTWSASPSWYWLHRCDRCCQRFFHERFYEVFPDAERDPDHGWWFECSRCITISLTRMVEKAARDGKYPRTFYSDTEVRT